jgi:hypothetical protein
MIKGCPFCRKVREAICVLDLDVIIYPCPREVSNRKVACCQVVQSLCCSNRQPGECSELVLWLLIMRNTYNSDSSYFLNLVCQTLKAYSICKESRYRPAVLEKGGQLKFPFLIDPNSNGPASQG